MDWYQVYSATSRSVGLSGGRAVKSPEARGQIRATVMPPDQRLQVIGEIYGGARDPWGQSASSWDSAPRSKPRASAPVTEEEVIRAIQKEAPRETGVREHVTKGAKKGIKKFAGQIGEALEEKVLPVLLERIIGRVLGMLTRTKDKEGKEAVIQGGAMMIRDSAKQYNMVVKPDVLMRALQGNHKDRAKLIRRVLMKSLR